MVETAPGADWDEAPRIAAPAMPVLGLDGFAGPLDFLLELAERQRIDLGKLSILAVVEQFAAVLAQAAARIPLEQRADWLVLTAKLVLLRARLLCPADPQDAADAEREAAQELHRLDERARMRAAANWLQARPQLGSDVFTRPPPEEPGREGGYVALLEACLVVLRGRPGMENFAPPETLRVTIPDMWRMQDALTRIRMLLPSVPEGAPLAAFLPPITGEDPLRALKSRAALASTFAAGLELARQEVLTLRQEQDFTVIVYAPVPR